MFDTRTTAQAALLLSLTALSCNGTAPPPLDAKLSATQRAIEVTLAEHAVGIFLQLIANDDCRQLRALLKGPAPEDACRAFIKSARSQGLHLAAVVSAKPDGRRPDVVLVRVSKPQTAGHSHAPDSREINIRVEREGERLVVSLGGRRRSHGAPASSTGTTPHVP